MTALNKDLSSLMLYLFSEWLPKIFVDSRKNKTNLERLSLNNRPQDRRKVPVEKTRPLCRKLVQGSD